MIEIIIAFILGIILGTLCGLIPGIHINLVMSVMILNLDRIQAYLPVSDVSLIVFITSLSIVYISVGFIPSIFLGAPSEENFLAVLPGHKMLQEGRGYEALLLSLIGTIIAVPALVIIIPIFLYFLADFYNLIKDIIAFILIFFSLYIILRDSKVWNAFMIFMLSGLLGIFTFNTPVKEPLLPLLTGLFGLSSLLISLEASKIREQSVISLKALSIDKKSLTSSFLSSLIASPFCSFLPGIGSGHAAMMSSEINTKQQESKYFLASIGMINVIVMTLSFVTAYTIDKARTGSAAAVQNALDNFSSNYLVIIISTVFISLIVAFLLAMNLGKIFCKILNKIDYRMINFATIFIVLTANMLLSNFLGLITLASATFLGLYCTYSETRKINLMGALILPSIIYYLIS